MDRPELNQSLQALLEELMNGPPGRAAYVLNGGDKGLLGSLEHLSAADASRVSDSGGGSIAQHVDHVCYGFELMNRWRRGEQNPWATADWAASWRRGPLSEPEWKALVERLRSETQDYKETIATDREMSPGVRTSVIGSIVHLAYHVGAIRQIDRSTAGPPA